MIQVFMKIFGLLAALALAACANGDPLSVPQGKWQPVNPMSTQAQAR